MTEVGEALHSRWGRGVSGVETPMKKLTPLVLALLAAGCARAVTSEEPVPLDVPAPDPDQEARALVDAAVLLIEHHKLMPLADALRALGPEPDPREAAETIERVLGVR